MMTLFWVVAARAGTAEVQPVDPQGAGQWVYLILSAGGAAAIYTLVRAFLALRGDVDGREATAIARLEKWAEAADRRADEALADGDHLRVLVGFWQARSGVLEHLAIAHGLDVPPLPPIPQKQHPAAPAT